MRQRLYVDPTGWRGTTENLAMLPVVQDAVARDRKLAMRYRSAGKSPEERVVAPLGLVAKAMTWYLVAQAEAGLRTYRVSRIEDGAVCSTTRSSARRISISRSTGPRRASASRASAGDTRRRCASSRTPRAGC